MKNRFLKVIYVLILVLMLFAFCLFSRNVEADSSFDINSSELYSKLILMIICPSMIR